MIRNKYKNTREDLVKKLVKGDRKTIVLNISVIETSKVIGHLIYECTYLDNGVEKTTNIIAEDITDAMNKLEPLLNSGIPSATINYMLGSKLLV